MARYWGGKLVACLLTVVDSDASLLATCKHRCGNLRERVHPGLRVRVAVHPDADVAVLGVDPDDIAVPVVIPVREVEVAAVEITRGFPDLFLRAPE